MTRKRTEYEAASRSRAMLRAQAQLNGWEVLDVLGAYLTPDGDVIVLTKDGRRYGVTVPFSPVDPEGERVKSVPTVSPPARSRKVYAPKSWDPAKWNRNVETIRSEAMTKDDVIANFTEAADKQAETDPVAKKRLRHTIAVIQALPDAPDWYDSLPLADL
jgi:hypothetical protein